MKNSNQSLKTIETDKTWNEQVTTRCRWTSTSRLQGTWWLKPTRVTPAPSRGRSPWKPATCSFLTPKRVSRLIFAPPPTRDRWGIGRGARYTASTRPDPSTKRPTFPNIGVASMTFGTGAKVCLNCLHFSS